MFSFHNAANNKTIETNRKPDSEQERSFADESLTMIVTSKMLYSTYSIMLQQDNKSYLKWTPEHFQECIEIAHLSIYALDQDGRASNQFYREQKDVIDEMCNLIGYNFTVTVAERNGNQLKVTIKVYFVFVQTNRRYYDKTFLLDAEYLTHT